MTDRPIRSDHDIHGALDDDPARTGPAPVMRKKDGGPAFPGAITDYGGVVGHTPGMTLRDWFAGQALAGLMADPEMNSDPDPVAKVCYHYADAMIATRAR